jgi:hypothetical protein
MSGQRLVAPPSIRTPPAWARQRAAGRRAPRRACCTASCCLPSPPPCAGLQDGDGGAQEQQRALGHQLGDSPLQAARARSGCGCSSGSGSGRTRPGGGRRGRAVSGRCGGAEREAAGRVGGDHCWACWHRLQGFGRGVRWPGGKWTAMDRRSAMPKHPAPRSFASARCAVCIHAVDSSSGDSKLASGSCCSLPPGGHLGGGNLRGQPGGNLGATWGQPGGNLGVTCGGLDRGILGDTASWGLPGRPSAGPPPRWRPL